MKKENNNYKLYELQKQEINDYIKDAESDSRILILSGDFGSGKTKLIDRVKTEYKIKRIKIIDFDKYALNRKNRDSLFYIAEKGSRCWLIKWIICLLFFLKNNVFLLLSLFISANTVLTPIILESKISNLYLFVWASVLIPFIYIFLYFPKIGSWKWLNRFRINPKIIVIDNLDRVNYKLFLKLIEHIYISKLNSINNKYILVFDIRNLAKKYFEEFGEKAINNDTYESIYLNIEKYYDKSIDLSLSYSFNINAFLENEFENVKDLGALTKNDFIKKISRILNELSFNNLRVLRKVNHFYISEWDNLKDMAIDHIALYFITLIKIINPNLILEIKKNSSIQALATEAWHAKNNVPTNEEKRGSVEKRNYYNKIKNKFPLSFAFLEKILINWNNNDDNVDLFIENDDLFIEFNDQNTWLYLETETFVFFKEEMNKIFKSDNIDSLIKYYNLEHKVLESCDAIFFRKKYCLEKIKYLAKYENLIKLPELIEPLYLYKPDVVFKRADYEPDLDPSELLITLFLIAYYLVFKNKRKLFDFISLKDNSFDKDNLGGFKGYVLLLLRLNDDHFYSIKNSEVFKKMFKGREKEIDRFKRYSDNFKNTMNNIGEMNKTSTFKIMNQILENKCFIKSKTPWILTTIVLLVYEYNKHVKEWFKEIDEPDKIKKFFNLRNGDANKLEIKFLEKELDLDNNFVLNKINKK